MREIERRVVQRPKTLFLIDSLGAFVTAFFLFGILRPFHEYFGMPQTVLTYLTLIALAFCLYSIACFLLLKDNWKPFLRAISIGNLFYCGLTMGMVAYFYDSLTILAMAYFMIEIVLVCGLVYIELRALRK